MDVWVIGSRSLFPEEVYRKIMKSYLDYKIQKLEILEICCEQTCYVLVTSGHLSNINVKLLSSYQWDSVVELIWTYIHASSTYISWPFISSTAFYTCQIGRFEQSSNLIDFNLPQIWLALVLWQVGYTSIEVDGPLQISTCIKFEKLDLCYVW